MRISKNHFLKGTLAIESKVIVINQSALALSLGGQVLFECIGHYNILRELAVYLRKIGVYS